MARVNSERVFVLVDHLCCFEELVTDLTECYTHTHTHKHGITAVGRQETHHDRKGKMVSGLKI